MFFFCTIKDFVTGQNLVPKSPLQMQTTGEGEGDGGTESTQSGKRNVNRHKCPTNPINIRNENKNIPISVPIQPIQPVRTELSSIRYWIMNFKDANDKNRRRQRFRALRLVEAMDHSIEITRWSPRARMPPLVEYNSAEEAIPDMNSFGYLLQRPMYTFE